MIVFLDTWSFSQITSMSTSKGEGNSPIVLISWYHSPKGHFRVFLPPGNPMITIPGQFHILFVFPMAFSLYFTQQPERRGESKLGTLSPHVALKLVLRSLETKKKKTKRSQTELYYAVYLIFQPGSSKTLTSPKPPFPSTRNSSKYLSDTGCISKTFHCRNLS